MQVWRQHILGHFWPPPPLSANVSIWMTHHPLNIFVHSNLTCLNMNIEYIQCKLLMTPFLSYKINFVQVFVVYAYIQEEYMLAVCQGNGIWIWYWIHIILRQLTKYEYCIYSFISYKYQIYLLYQNNDIPISNIQTLMGILEYIHVTLYIGNGAGCWGWFASVA